VQSEFHKVGTTALAEGDHFKSEIDKIVNIVADVEQEFSRSNQLGYYQNAIIQAKN
jgi:hypothetical protein